MKKFGKSVRQTAGFWIWLNATDPERYKKLNAISRLKHKVRRRTRAINWNKVNAERRNARRRVLYAETKIEAQANQINQTKSNKQIRSQSQRTG